MTGSKAFVAVKTWVAAAQMVSFKPRVLGEWQGRQLKALYVHVRDHKGKLPVARRSIEAYYEGFVFTQTHRPLAEARRWATEVRFGREPRDVLVGGHEGRMYELGPEVPADDIDGRSPAVIVWNEGKMFYLLASGEMTLVQLLPITGALYAR